MSHSLEPNACKVEKYFKSSSQSILVKNFIALCLATSDAVLLKVKKPIFLTGVLCLSTSSFN